MERITVASCIDKIGQKVLLYGWVNSIRNHGKIIFADLRDRSGIIQIVGGKSLADLNLEDVVKIEGSIKKRPEKMINPDLETGTVELEVETVEVLSKAKELPFNIYDDGAKLNEEIRLKYRYLDLRRPRLIKNISTRYEILKFIRNWLDKNDFLEIETPILTKSTPEGARDFLVPSRLQKGKFYALPQSPQQYKQLLMVAGIERYFQVARCFRDEDLRADRQLEFTQLDIEVSFADRDQIIELIERMMIDLSNHMGKKIFSNPFPRIDFAKAVKEYGDDKFDLRKNKDKDTLAFAWVINQPLFEWKKQENRWDALHHPFTAPNPEDLKYLNQKEAGKVRSWQYDLVLNGFEAGGGSIRIVDPTVQEKVFEIMGHSKKGITSKFGHLLEAFSYGVPTMGGIAIGIDRLVQIFTNETSIREVIAFPVSSSGQTSVMDAPSDVDNVQLKELGIKVTSQDK